MLAAHIGIADDAVTIDDKQGRALAQRKESAFNFVPVVYVTRNIRQTGEGYVMFPGVGVGRRLSITDEGDYLRAGALIFSVLLRQPTKMPAAKRSHKATQKYQDDRRFAEKIMQGDILPIRVGECEVRGGRAYRNQFTFDWHQALL